jgi:hypothetical protein
LGDGVANFLFLIGRIKKRKKRQEISSGEVKPYCEEKSEIRAKETLQNLLSKCEE